MGTFINHPLDCPICGNLENACSGLLFEFGSGKSEMEYSKRVYGWRDIGTFVALERNRCIHCTRCDRSPVKLQEQTNSGCLTVVMS